MNFPPEGFHWVDAARSIVFGQSITIAFFAITNVVMNIIFYKPRPARIVGLVLGTLSYVGALGCVAIVAIGRHGQPATYLIWVALVIVGSGTLSVSLLLAHVVLHSTMGMRIVEKWFGEHPDGKRRRGN